MLDLSPTKLIIIFIVVIVLMGPKRLPQVARQMGVAWKKLTGFQQQIEHDLRQQMPDLPSSQEIVRFARSPVTMLNQFAQMSNGAEAGPAPKEIGPRSPGELGESSEPQERASARTPGAGAGSLREAGESQLVSPRVSRLTRSLEESDLARLGEYVDDPTLN